MDKIYSFLLGMVLELVICAILITIVESKYPTAIEESKCPTAIDVYRGNTTLEITYKDSIAIDSVVVFKNK